MSKAISFSNCQIESRSSQTDRSFGNMGHRQVEDISVKCEIAAANRPQSEARRDIAKAIGYFALSAACAAAMLAIAIKIIVATGSLLFFAPPLAVVVGLGFVAFAATLLLEAGVELIFREIFARGMTHLNRGLGATNCCT